MIKILPFLIRFSNVASESWMKIIEDYPIKANILEKDVEAGITNGAMTYLFKPDDDNVQTKSHHMITDLREVLRELNP